MAFRGLMAHDVSNCNKLHTSGDSGLEGKGCWGTIGGNGGSYISS